jgi:patatin-related protein
MATTHPPILAPEAPPQADIRELRIALVCYGGVSLAIYMHGVTREIHTLIRASAAYDRNQTGHAFPAGSGEAVYWEILQNVDRESGTRLRVVVDIIAGTSAGGINGICLAKAIALNCSQAALRDLWFDRGDITKLVAGPKWMPAPLRVPLMAIGSAVGMGLNAPLRGDSMCRWLYEAFEAMDATAPANPESLLPPDHPLELFVTVTDLEGYGRELTIEDPRVIRDRTHRHVLIFKHGNESAGFGPSQNHSLAFAARATSSFPGAFPPLSFDDYQGFFEPSADLKNLAEEQFAIYRMNGGNPTASAFVDGGVLDNAPFLYATAAIRRRSASVQVDRRLVFIEPDPVQEGLPAAPRVDNGPGWFRTIAASLSSIPAGQPILDELNELAERNRTVRRIRDVIETNFTPIKQMVEGLAGRHQLSLAQLSAQTPAAALDKLRADIDQASVENAGFTHPTYLRVRVGMVLDSYAAMVADSLDYPATSYPARFVEVVVRDWARDIGLSATSPDAGKQQVEFLRETELGYHQRRLRFLIAAFSWWYRTVSKSSSPSRAELDAAKATLYRRLAAIDGVIPALMLGAEGRHALEQAFSKEKVREGAKMQRRDYAQSHGADLDHLQALVRKAVTAHVAELEVGLYNDLVSICASWPEDTRTDLFARYLGFPFWDVIVLPIQSLSTAVDERDHVEVMRVSPLDSRILGDDGPKKLKGIGLHHFAAFFKREYRENDYLWGRLDAAERLVGMLLDDPMTPGLDPAPAACVPVFEAILREEEPALKTVSNVVTEVQRRVKRIKNGSAVSGEPLPAEALSSGV